MENKPQADTVGANRMTLEQLEQYHDLRREAALWARELQELQRRAECAVADTVRGSSPEFPYTAHTVTVRGVRAEPNPRIVQRQKRLAERRARLDRQLQDIDEFIDSLQDSQLRQIIEYRYINGYSWVKTARLVNNKESAVRMRIQRYFK